MSLESDLRDLLSSLVDGRVHPDTSPDVPVYPFITYQQVGGQALRFTESAKPSHKHARVQFNVWAKTRTEANTIARAIEDRLNLSAMIAETYGAFTALYQESLKNYGTRQDFGVWFED